MNVQVRVKICGLTSVSDAVHAAQCGADAIGIVFYPPSPRHIDDFGLARDIALSIGPFVDVVGLFVDPEPEYVERIQKEVPINCLQFHGGESNQFCEQFSRPYMKALRMKTGLDVRQERSRYSTARGLLLDTYVQGVPGGTGATFNWGRVPKGLNNIVLAGGLTPENVHDAIVTASPYAVDVSGGVEQAPGQKDPGKVEAFIKNAKFGVPK